MSTWGGCDGDLVAAPPDGDGGEVYGELYTGDMEPPNTCIVGEKEQRMLLIHNMHREREKEIAVLIQNKYTYHSSFGRVLPLGH